MPDTNLQEEVENLQQQIVQEEETAVLEMGSGTCPLCKHASRDQITEVYYDTKQSIESSKKWFENKFKRNFADTTWESHFRNHVEPFVQSHQIIRQKKLNDLMEKSAEIKKNQHTTAITMIKQMLFETIVDGYVAKPDNIVTKEDLFKWEKVAKTMATTLKPYIDFTKMELEMLNFGKTREEQEEVMAGWMSSFIKDIKKALKGIPEAEKRIEQLFENPDHLFDFSSKSEGEEGTLDGSE